MVFFGNETEFSVPVTVKFEDITPPPAPENLNGKADSMKVHLNWRNVSVDDFQGVYIYRSKRSDGPYEKVIPQQLGFDTETFTDSLTMPGPYYYYVSSSDRTGNESPSRTVFVEVQDVMPPARPEELSMKTDTGRVSLTWKMGTEPDLAGYYIYRTVNQNNKKHYVLLNAVPLKADHFEQGLPRNVKNRFFYFIVAVDTFYNRSKPSAFVSGAMPDILAPEKPFIKNVSYEDDQIIIEWIRNVDTDFAGYHIFRSDTSKNFSRLNVNLLGRETFRYTDRENQPNLDYYYYVVALDSAGNTSRPSDQVYGRRVVKDPTSNVKIDLKVKYNKKRRQNTLRWELESPDAVSGFVVFSGEHETQLTPITGLIKTKNFVDKKEGKQKPGVKYYQVRAYVGGEVVYSDVLKQSL